MSGPKVVRIVTREELVAIAHNELCRLDECVARWINDCANYGIATTDDIDRVEERKNNIHNLLSGDRLTDISAQVNSEIEYLRNDLQSRKNKKYQREVAKRAQRRVVRDAAESLLLRVQESDLSLPDELFAKLDSIVQKAGSIVNEEQVLSDVMLYIADSSQSQKLTEAQSTLASKLKSNDRSVAFEQWLKQNARLDTQEATIDRYIAELEVEMGDEYVVPLLEKMTVIANEASSSRRNMLYQTLIAELSSDARHRRDINAAFEEIESNLAQLGNYDQDNALEIRNRFMMASRDELHKLLEINKSIQSKLELLQKEHAQHQRRNTILQGLSALGYEVRQGMLTALVEDGRLTLRKPNNYQYGIELISPTSDNKMQVRPVAYAADPDAYNHANDVQIENTWCSEFLQLQHAFSSVGGELILEAAKAVGEVPLKVIQDDVSEQVDQISKPLMSTNKD